MEWKKIITAIAALMLAYSLVGCASNSTSTSTTTSEAEEVAPVGTEIKANKKSGFSYNYMVDVGLYGKVGILTDRETGVEYILIDAGESGIAITPRLKGDE